LTLAQLDTRLGADLGFLRTSANASRSSSAPSRRPPPARLLPPPPPPPTRSSRVTATISAFPSPSSGPASTSALARERKASSLEGVPSPSPLHASSSLRCCGEWPSRRRTSPWSPECKNQRFARPSSELLLILPVLSRSVLTLTPSYSSTGSSPRTKRSSSTSNGSTPRAPRALAPIGPTSASDARLLSQNLSNILSFPPDCYLPTIDSFIQVAIALGIRRAGRRAEEQP
jgi:hypothetical protein